MEATKHEQLVTKRVGESVRLVKNGVRRSNRYPGTINHAYEKGDSDALLRVLKARTFWKDSCWVWTGPVGPEGRPRATFLSRQIRPQRLVLELEGYELRPHQQIKVTCGESRCLNPDHLHIIRDI